MPEIRKPAVKIQQGKRSLFLTSFTVGDFMKKDFYRVDRLDVQKEDGMQRLLNDTRARNFSKDIINADSHNEAFLPTSVFLATGGSINYDEITKELFFEEANICPLDVVDGQHRIEGLRLAAKSHEHFRNFPISVVIADELKETEKMLQFITVNTTQQAVDRGVSQHITSRFSKMKGIKDLPYLPSWLSIAVEKGADEKALDIARYLNSEESSPWKGRIRLADKPRLSQHTINQSTFVMSIKRHILPKNHPLHYIVAEDDKRRAMLNNFWIAVKNIFVEQPDDATNSVVFKYTGLQFFLAISAPVFSHLTRNRTYTVKAIEDCIRSVQDHIASDMVYIMNPDFWKIGNAAGRLNNAGISQLITEFARALAQVDKNDFQL